MRFIFCKQASKIKQHRNGTKPYLGQWLTKATQLTTISLLLIGFGFIPEQVQADTARIDNITIDRQPDETYNSLIQRAESAARTAVRQSFAQGSQITNVSVVISGQNQGVIAPILTVGVSRLQWNRNGNAQDGFTYFNSARSLLRLDEQQLATADSPQKQRTTPFITPRRQLNNPNIPGSARQIINNTPIQPLNSAPGGAPLPGSPALVPRPQTPGITPVTSPGNNLNQSPRNNQNQSSPRNNFNNTPTSSPVAPVTAPTPQNLPQVNPAEPDSIQR